MIFIGYDPGGQDRRNGIALLDNDGVRPTFIAASVSSAGEAIDWVKMNLDKRKPTAAGIDTLLYWDTGKTGVRAADRWLRKEYPNVAKSVLSANSLYGSMVVQGMAFAIRLRQIWDDLPLVETHPKVLHHALLGKPAKVQRWKMDSDTMRIWLADQIGVADASTVKTDDEWDALMSAWAAWQSTIGAWSHDLRLASTDAIEPAGPVAYLWPE
jgi:hypothetical protein